MLTRYQALADILASLKRAENRGEAEESLGPERKPRAEEAKTATPSVLSVVIG